MYYILKMSVSPNHRLQVEDPALIIGAGGAARAGGELGGLQLFNKTLLIFLSSLCIGSAGSEANLHLQPHCSQYFRHH